MQMIDSNLCPFCEKEMGYFEKTPAMNTLYCKECKCTFSEKTSWGVTQDALLTIITVLTGVIALIAFFGIRTIDDLVKSN